MSFRRLSRRRWSRWCRDSMSPILFVHHIWWSYVRILTSNLESEQSGYDSKFKTSIYRTPRYHWDSSSKIWWWRGLYNVKNKRSWNDNVSFDKKSKSKIEWSKVDDKFRDAKRWRRSGRGGVDLRFRWRLEWRGVFEMGHMSPNKWLSFFVLIEANMTWQTKGFSLADFFYWRVCV